MTTQTQLDWCNSFENSTTKAVVRKLASIDLPRVRKVLQFTIACMGDDECETVGTRRVHAAAREVLGMQTMKESWVLGGNQGIADHW